MPPRIHRIGLFLTHLFIIYFLENPAREGLGNPSLDCSGCFPVSDDVKPSLASLEGISGRIEVCR